MLEGPRCDDLRDGVSSSTPRSPLEYLVDLAVEALSDLGVFLEERLSSSSEYIRLSRLLLLRDDAWSSSSLCDREEDSPMSDCALPFDLELELLLCRDEEPGSLRLLEPLLNMFATISIDVPMSLCRCRCCAHLL